MDNFTTVVLVLFILGISATIGYFVNDSARDKACADGTPIVIKSNVYQCVKKEVK